MVNTEQLQRYERNMLVPDIGIGGQELLLDARVCVVGLGGLGSPAALYLAAAGVGALGLVDSDVVELSNLQRQILHTTPRVGMSKTDSASETLSALNPEVELHTIDTRLTEDNALGIFSDYDVVVEATDNFETKFLINDVCLKLGKPFATAGILALEGHAMFVAPGQTACLRCALRDVPANQPTTGELGVLGAIPGLLGSLQALMVIRHITGIWKPEPDGACAMHTVDGRNLRLRSMKLPRNTACSCGPIWSNG